MSGAERGSGELRRANDSLEMERERLDKMIERKTVARVAVGDPQTEIIRAARAHGAELVVLGVHSRRGRGVDLSSTAKNVIRRGSSPVLVVKDRLLDLTHARSSRSTSRTCRTSCSRPLASSVETMCRSDWCTRTMCRSKVPSFARRSADLVVVGTHGRTGLSKFFLGSLAHWMLENAPCDVLVGRPERFTIDSD